jgi:hypothetical protein
VAQKSSNLSRAEQVRARRQLEPMRRKTVPSSSTRTARDTQNASKVISRRAPSASAYSSMAVRPSARKRIYVPSGQTGAEVRLPALPQIQLSWRILSALIAISMAVLAYLMKDSDMFLVSTLTMSGGQRVPPQEIVDLLHLKGESIIEIVPTEAEDLIRESFADIKDVKVSVRLPSAIDIEVMERIPAIVWVQAETPLFWIDQDGYTFPIRGEATLPVRVASNALPPHPLGYVDPAAALTAETDAAGEVAPEPKVMPSVDPGFVLAVQKLNTIIPVGTTLLYDEQNGLGWTDPRGWKVYFGQDLSQVDLKLVEYEYIIQAILDRNLQPSLISLEFLHAPYYRLE